MKILLLFVIILTLIFLLDFFKVNKVVRFALVVDIAMVIMIVYVDKQIPAVYYMLYVLSLFTYMYCISGMILKTVLIKGRIYRFTLILIGIILCLGAMQLFEDRFCPVNYDYGINVSRLIQVLGPAVVLLFIVDEFKTFINND
jgi:hypothetical protein